MKKIAFMNLIKDLILAGVFALIGYTLMTGADSSVAAGCALLAAGVPFGWRWASNIITAVSLQGIGIKLVIALILGWAAAGVTLVGDVIRCFTAPSGRSAT